MNSKSIGTNCTTYCWSVGVISGVLAFLALWGLIGAAPYVALVLGLAIAVGAGLFLVWAFCEPLANSPRDTEAAAPVVPPASAAEAPAVRDEPVAPATPAPAAGEPSVPVTPPPAEPPRSAAAPEPAEVAGATPAGVGLLSTPDGQADDLKRIKGVGPALERKLNDLGVFHYAQIAAWGADEVAWVDAHLNFRGRIDRDDWIAQARTLATGGETEFSRRTGGK